MPLRERGLAAHARIPLVPVPQGRRKGGDDAHEGVGRGEGERGGTEGKCGGCGEQCGGGREEGGWQVGC